MRAFIYFLEIEEMYLGNFFVAYLMFDKIRSYFSGKVLVI